MQEFVQPDFFLCEIPIKDGSFNDHRLWVYHRPSLSLIEFIEVSKFKNFEFEGKQELFLYQDEEWFGVFVQNNCNALDQNPDDVLKNAWVFLSQYLAWEDRNIDETEKTSNN